jgi:hypothetical protein
VASLLVAMATVRSTLKHGWEYFKGRTIDKMDRFALKLPLHENLIYLTPYSRAFHSCKIEYGEGRAKKGNPAFEKYAKYTEARAVRWLKKEQYVRVMHLLEEACIIAAKFDPSLEARYNNLINELEKPKSKRMELMRLFKNIFQIITNLPLRAKKANLLPNENSLKISPEEG